MTTRIDGALIIHLPRATARAAQVRQLQQQLPVPTTVLEAVDGRTAGPEILAAYDPAGGALRPAYPFGLQPSEIACFLSHRAAWSHILEARWEAAVILEDDAGLEPEIFAQALALAQAHPGDGLIQLQTRAQPEADVIAREGAVTLTEPALSPLRTTAAVVTRQAATGLLAATETFDRPIDVMLQMHWVTGVRARVIWPSGVQEVSDAVGGTTIQKKNRGMWDRVNREIRRPLFRAAMARRARAGR
ncbi:hypothetical protein JANAI62_31680 [Jannaschia pagri]|uniref:Glycosyl transferase family 25 domain-containing protein n=1 Tax=Jannaschia pagri TaxID=2829797 RepID=A0ABQ4NQ55_9RHOB|nr:MULTISPECIES: glycosyltransferase family 25 protein [unclassified Jannaschia]GIT92595.1 hypothetical protein JANAI61_30530 [Jannaschia sp. AI_61]GIT96545.1 hypothetical protein JANAI62_31680 [Jannaschia sp. AI_62]